MPLPLDYEVAKVYFSGEQRARSWVGALGLLLCCVFAGIGLTLLLGIIPGQGNVTWILGLAFGGFGLLTAGAVAIGMAIDYRTRLEIRSDCVRMGWQTRTWSQIRSVGAIGNPTDPWVELYFVDKHGLTYTLGRGVMRLTPAAYESLIAQLHAEVGPNHPNVDFTSKYQPRGFGSA